MINAWFRLASLVMLVAVVLGAFGAHGLKSRISPDALELYRVAALYQCLYGLSLFVVSWAATQSTSLRIPMAGYAFILGILLFSGSLYAISLTGMKWFGAITPLGGLAFITGWFLLATAK